MAADWSSLPFDLLALIALKLETFENFIYFSAVCRCWNRASSSIKPRWRATPVVPWLLLAENTRHNPNGLRNIFNFNNNNNKCYKFNLPEIKVGARCWGSAYGWVAMVDRDLNVQLFNPITKAHIPFPSVETLDSEGNVNGVDESDYIDWFLGAFLVKLVVIKVSQSEFVIVVIHDLSKRVAFARQGDQMWTSVFIEEKCAKMVDVVGIDDNVFALYDDGAIIYWNVNESLGLELVKPMDYSSSKREILEELNEGPKKLYLVQSGSDLLMVLRYKEEVYNSDCTDYNYDLVYRTVDFEVFKLNPKEKSWEEVENLGDVALFVGCSSSMSVSVEHAKCLRRSCIYFTDDEGELWGLPTKSSGHDMGVYDMTCDKKWGFYEGEDMYSLFCPPTWFIPQF